MARRVSSCGICENVNLPSACAACVNSRLVDKYKLLKKLSRDRDFLHMRVDAQLKAKSEADEQHHWSVTHTEHIARLKEKLRNSENELLKGKAELEEKQRDLDARSSFQAAASAQLAKKKVEQLGQFYPDLVRTHLLGHTSVASELHQKRRTVIRQLCKVFPLKRMLPSNAGERSEYWTLCGARLPLGDNPHSVSTQELAASLGYTVQLLNLVARYLSAPLLHNARFAGSASRVWQRTSYWDARSSCSEEFPLFIPQHSHSLSEEHILRDSGFSAMEGTSKGRLEDFPSSSSRYGSSSLQASEMHTDVQKGIRLLKRSVGCISAYGFNLLFSSVPSNMTTFQTFAELMALLSSKEIRLRPGRSSQHQNNPLAESTVSSASTMEISRQEKDIKSSSGGNFNSTNSFLCIGRDFDQMEVSGKYGESVSDGWDMVEHPTLPPPPSHTEDVEHWTRAMFVDATK